MNQPRLDERLIDHMTEEIAGWLELPDPDRALRALQRWDAAKWQAARQVTFFQGVAPYLHRRLSQTSLYPALPRGFRNWLADQYELNGHRVQRLHTELATILQAAHRASIAVMPLKGCLLTTLYYPDPALRPMADIDLLIRPADRAEMAAILQNLGYRCVPNERGYANHDFYLNPAGEKLASWEGEHPDNPRPVEIHLEIRRRLWGALEAYDLTELLWSGSQPVEILGQPAWAPRREMLLAYLAIHAMYHAIVFTGRLTHWLDLAALAPGSGDLTELPYPRLIYPALRLTQRVMPNTLADVDLTGLARRVPRRLRRWSECVPLDSRCGLNTGRSPDARSQLRLHWERWLPAPWRLAVGYGDVSLPTAFLRHLGMMLGYGKVIFRRSISHP